MMRTERPPCDHEVRERVTRDLNTTFLLEASAGTGKTKVLVDRYVACVLDADHGTQDVRRVAAITFTEKAAGELRQRVRERFEQLAGAAPQGAAEAPIIAAALDALDDAPISTIHSFAGRLLREFPVEAGIDPAFEQLDQLGSEIERARLWEEWLTELAAGGPGHERPRGWLKRLLWAGIRLDVVRELAMGAKGLFGERYDLDLAPEPPPPPDLSGGLLQLLGPLDRLREHCVNACTDRSDNGFKVAMDLVTALDQCATLAGEETCDLDQLATALLAAQVKTGTTGPGGRKGNWDEALGGKDELLACYGCVAEGIVALRDEYALHVTGLAIAVADAFARWAGGVQLDLGRLDFTDLLGQLRDLLVRDLAARRSLQERFGYLLVDEFQDTDPLQAESVVLLCEREPIARDWRDVVLAPGKLFVVGDPKQSIYRFRRADISLYDEVKELVRSQPQKQGEVLAIAQNFRATPALVGWANNVFGDIFDAEQEVGRQPGYQWVEAYRPSAPGARVAVLLGREYGRQAGESDAARRDEARALAGLLLEICEGDRGEWTVCDRALSTPGEEVTRPARWGDVALLVRATTGLETYEQTLREAGIPYRVEGGKTYFQRREVTDVLLCLRAIDDPSDGPAVYGALHSSLFGFSDDDLFLFWAAGGRFERGVETQPEGRAAVAEALGVLWGLHERRRVCETHELIEELLRATRAEELQAATGAAGQALANLEKLIERARAFTGAGGGGLGAFLAWAAEAGDAAGERESQVDDKADVVHLLTIHGAKGLEWPIVVLAGAAMAGSGGHGGPVEPIVDRRRRRVVVKLKADLPGATRDLIPRAYEELIEYEKGMAQSEARRLLYVALTRARDRLVVSCFGRLENAKGEATAALLGPLHQLLPAPGSVSERHEREGLLVLVPEAPPVRQGRAAQPDVPALLAARTAWMRAREELLARAARPARATSPSALEQVDDAVRVGGAGAPPGRARALALGAAVHRVMEFCDLNDAASLDPLAEHAAAEFGYPDLAARVTELAAVCWHATPVRAAARSGDVYRELVVGVLVGDTIMNGAVDLLYRDGAAWVVVDYKTDRTTDAATLRARYAPQGAAYALAVEAATGEPVREVVFVAAAAAGLEIVVPVSDQLRERARRDVVAAGAHGVAVAGDELGGEA